MLRAVETAVGNGEAGIEQRVDLHSDHTAANVHVVNRRVGAAAKVNAAPVAFEVDGEDVFPVRAMNFQARALFAQKRAQRRLRFFTKPAV